MMQYHLVPGLTVLGVALLTVSAEGVDCCQPSTPSKNPPGVGIMVRSDVFQRDLAQCFRRCFPVYARAEEAEFSSEIQVAGWIAVEPVCSDNQIALNLTASGNLLGNSVRTVEGVMAFTRERASFFVSVETFLDEKAISLGGLAVSLPVHSELLGIRTAKPSLLEDFVQGIGEARFDIGRSSDDRKISSGAEQQMRQAFARQRCKLERDLNKWYRDEFLAGIYDTGLTRGELHFHSDEQAVALTAQIKGQALPEPPNLPNRSMVMQLHPNTFNVLTNRSLAGKSYNEEQLEKMFTNLSRYFQLPPLAKREEKALTVTLAKKDPLTLKIEDKHLIVTLRGASYRVEDDIYPGMNVTARYRVERKGEELHLVRDAELEVLPPGFKAGMVLGFRELALRTILRRRFSRLLLQDIALQDIHLRNLVPTNIIPANLAKEEDLKLTGAFRIDLIETTAGWLTVGLNFRPEKCGSAR